MTPQELYRTERAKRPVQSTETMALLEEAKRELDGGTKLFTLCPPVAPHLRCQRCNKAQKAKGVRAKYCRKCGIEMHKQRQRESWHRNKGAGLSHPCMHCPTIITGGARVCAACKAAAHARPRRARPNPTKGMDMPQRALHGQRVRDGIAARRKMHERALFGQRVSEGMRRHRMQPGGQAA